MGEVCCRRCNDGLIPLHAQWEPVPGARLKTNPPSVWLLVLRTRRRVALLLRTTRPRSCTKPEQLCVTSWWLRVQSAASCDFKLFEIDAHFSRTRTELIDLRLLSRVKTCLVRQGANKPAAKSSFSRMSELKQWDGKLYSSSGAQQHFGELDGLQYPVQSNKQFIAFLDLRFRNCWQRYGHPGGAHYQTHEDSNQLLPGQFGSGRSDGADGGWLTVHHGQHLWLLGVWPLRVPLHHLLPVSGDQRLLLLHNSVHHREIHRHLPSD